jgi:hypothetical protein
MASAPIVTRSKIWFYAGDTPYIDFEVKGTVFFIPFDKTLRFFRPTATKAIYPGPNPEEDGMDLRVPRTNWWILTDHNLETACEFSCSWSKLFGFQLKYFNSRTDTQIHIKLTYAEAKEVLVAVEKMMLDATKEESLVQEPVVLLKPFHTVLSYRAKALLYRRKMGKFVERLSYMSPYRAELADAGRKKK